MQAKQSKCVCVGLCVCFFVLLIEVEAVEQQVACLLVQSGGKLGEVVVEHAAAAAAAADNKNNRRDDDAKGSLKSKVHFD